MEDPGAELDDVVRSLLAPTMDDYGRMFSQISFRMTAPCDMLRKEENLALTTRSYPQYQRCRESTPRASRHGGRCTPAGSSVR